MNKEFFISNDNINVIEALTKIDAGGRGILYIVNNEQQLIGSVSDGDVRRWIIKTNDLAAKVSQFMNQKPKFLFSTDKTDPNTYIRKFPINSIPILNETRQIVNIIFANHNDVDKQSLSTGKLQGIPVVIMAGGKGTRLYPYTKILPKPLIPIGDTPIVERVINCYVKYGVQKYFMTVNYKKGMIKSYFGEAAIDYEIEYVEEDKPLGTGGSLKLINKKFDKPLFVTNCDALILADYEDIYDYHIKSGNKITIVSALKNIIVPYGVLHSKENGELINIEEKPQLSYFINTGMYVINPETIDDIPNDTLYHMTHLVETVMKHGGKVGMYPISEDSFLDMGEFGEMRRMEEKLNINME